MKPLLNPRFIPRILINCYSSHPQQLQFVPEHNPPHENDIKTLQNFVDATNKLLVLTGAGISTESGIPDYRSEVVGLYARSNHKPVQYQDFIRSPKIRQRYWARNYIGWPRFSSCQPNSNHIILKQLETNLTSIITQNVDSLHYKAGSKRVVELHGSAFRVLCLDCGKGWRRQQVQEQIGRLNEGGVKDEMVKMVRPDGDVELPMELVESFHTPVCESCGGTLKPDIVFFGDNVPRDRVDQIRSLVTESEAVLVLGSTLSVFSGYRIILQAVEESKPVGIVNIGPTRADKHAVWRISTRCGDILPRLTQR